MSIVRPVGGVVAASLAVAKGDLFVATGPGAVARLPTGTDGQILVADPTTATGLRWDDPPPPGYGLSPYGTGPYGGTGGSSGGSSGAGFGSAPFGTAPFGG